MLLTLTTTHRPATDLGFLLHKHPDRVQRLSLPFGHADVLYPEAGEERCTAALLVDVDPIGLVRRQGGAAGLTQYVNDRPYAASSLLSVALLTAFRTAMAGRCDARPELAASAIPLRAGSLRSRAAAARRSRAGSSSRSGTRSTSRRSRSTSASRAGARAATSGSRSRAPSGSPTCSRTCTC